MASLGYTCLVEKYSLDARPAQLCALIDSRIRGRERRQMDGQDILAFEAKYQPEDTFEGHLQFALRYEGINLEILALLFEKMGETELMAWLDASPTSTYARRAGFLYEWLTERKLPVDAIAARERYVPLVDDSLQICLPVKALPNNAPQNNGNDIVATTRSSAGMLPLPERRNCNPFKKIAMSISKFFQARRSQGRLL